MLRGVLLSVLLMIGCCCGLPSLPDAMNHSEEITIPDKDPCLNVCGQNTNCELINNSPMCSCKPGFTGHPFTGCNQAEEPECTSNSQCPAEEACLNGKCIDACSGVCGLNTVCRVLNHSPVCACSQGFRWNPGKGCQPESSPECTSDALCAPTLACRRQHCVDPCAGVCGNNTVCQVTDHHPACACAPGYTGNPFEKCEPQCSSVLMRSLNGTLVNSDSTTLASTPPEKKFHLHKGDLTWIQALAYCKSLNMSMSLLAVSSPQEQEKVEALMMRERLQTGVWTSGLKLANSQTYFWTTTGKYFEYLHLGSNALVANEECVFISAVSSPGYWLSDNCSRGFNVICQY